MKEIALLQVKVFRKDNDMPGITLEFESKEDLTNKDIAMLHFELARFNLDLLESGNGEGDIEWSEE